MTHRIQREVWYNVLILLYGPFEILGGLNMQSECNILLPPVVKSGVFLFQVNLT